MPYTYSEDGLCVHKKNPDGSMGENVGCSKTRAEAEKHMAALQAAMRAEGKNVGDVDENGAVTIAEFTEEEFTPENVLIAMGAVIKDLGGGKVGGYLVRFTTPQDPDLTGDFFDAKSEIHIPEGIPLLYNHGLDSTLKRSVIGKVSTKVDDVGVWAEAQMSLRNEYEKAIYHMAMQGKLGYSSGALSHLVDREPAGKAMHIKTWFIGEASLTPTPAEYRNTVQTLKSLQTSEAALSDGDVKESKSTKENKDMDENEIKAVADAAVAKALAERDATQKAESDKASALKAEREAGYSQALKDFREGKAPMVNVIDTNDTADNKNGGVTAFRHWVKTGQANSELILPETKGWRVNDPAANMKATFEYSAGTGPYLVPDILYSQIQPKRDLASFIRRTPAQVFSVVADHLLIPATDTKSAVFTLTAELAAYTEDDATLKQVDLKLYKFTKEVTMSEEFIMYNQTNFDAWLVNDLARAEAVTENALYATGAGGTTVEGATTNATAGNTVTTTAVWAPADLTALIGQLPGGYNVQGQCGWLLTNASKYYIKGLGTSTFPWFLSTGGSVGEDQLLGYPEFISDSVGAYTSTSATAKALTFANWNFYALGERPGMMIQRNPYLHMATGQVDLFCSIYRGGIPTQSEAFVYLVQKA